MSHTILKRSAIGTLTAGALLASSLASAAAIRTGFDSETAPRNDDGFVTGVSAGFDLNFFGDTYTDFFLNTNGNITFDGGLSTFTPFDLESTNQVIIAPFFADVDTRNANSSAITYGEGLVDGRDAFGINWVDVGFFGNRADPLNSFQLVLIDRSDTGIRNFDFEFNYDQILWETGEASGGSALGLGGSSARVGYSNGSDESFELNGSAINGAFLDGGPAATALVSNSLNSNEAGRYYFGVRNGMVIDPIDPIDPVDPNPVPAPAPLSLLALGLLLASRGRLRASS